MYLMHYSRVTDVPRLGAELKAQVRELADIALRNAGAPDPKAAMAAEMRASGCACAREHGVHADRCAQIDACLDNGSWS